MLQLPNGKSSYRKQLLNVFTVLLGIHWFSHILYVLVRSWSCTEGVREHDTSYSPLCHCLIVLARRWSCIECVGEQLHLSDSSGPFRHCLIVLTRSWVLIEDVVRTRPPLHFIQPIGLYLAPVVCCVFSGLQPLHVWAFRPQADCGGHSGRGGPVHWPPDPHRCRQGVWWWQSGAQGNGTLFPLPRLQQNLPKPAAHSLWPGAFGALHAARFHRPAGQLVAEGQCNEELCVCAGYFSCSASFFVFFVWGAIACNFCQLLLKKINLKKWGGVEGWGATLTRSSMLGSARWSTWINFFPVIFSSHHHLMFALVYRQRLFQHFITWGTDLP